MGFQVQADNEKQLEREIGFMVKQMVIVGFYGEDLSYMLKQGKSGGYILFSKNLTKEEGGVSNKETLLSIVSKLKSKNIKFIGIDNEGGLVNRLKNIGNFDTMPALAKLSKMPKSKRIAMAEHFALEMSNFGININFTPVVDLKINEDPEFFLIKSGRIISDNPDTVVEIASEIVDAHRKYNVLTSLKHFPGHGSAVSDSHLGFSDVTNTWKSTELNPYIAMIRSGKADMIMASHVFNKNFDKKYPASMSYNTVTNILRKKLGYDGVVITDSIDMMALTDNFSLDEIVVQAINAGADIILHANQTEYDRYIADKIYKIILDAVYYNKISKKRIYQSYNRISRIFDRCASLS